MPSTKQRLLALLSTGRIADLPGVATHVAVGFLLAYLSRGIPFGHGDLRDISFLGFVSLECGILVALGSLFHLGGSLLADAADARFDLQFHPGRPIPMGTLRAPSIALTGSLLIFAAWLIGCLAPTALVVAALDASFSDVLDAIKSGTILSIVHPFHLGATTGLAILVIVYATLHKRLDAFSPLMMAVCRVGLILWAALAGDAINVFGPDRIGLSGPVLLYASATFFHTLGLRLIVKPFSRRLVVPLVLAPLLILGIGIPQLDWHGASLCPLIALLVTWVLLLLWSLHALVRLQNSTPALVSAITAGYCLMDACFGALISWQVSVACVALFFVTLLIQHLVPAPGQE